MNTIDEQRQLLSYVDGMCSQEKTSGAGVQPLERQVAVHSGELASVHGDMTWPEESVTVDQQQLADAQSAH